MNEPVNRGRLAVHVSMVGFALLIGRLAPWLIALCAGGAFVFNLWLLPRLTRRRLEKPQERAQGLALGLLMYPAVLTGLALLFYQQQVFLAVGWGAMAFGDAAAGYLGRRGGRPIPWQPSKHWLGVIAFVLVAFPLTLGLIWLLPEATRLGLPMSSWAWLLLGALLLAALVETIPGLIDDNFSVPLAASLAALLGYQWLTQGAFFLLLNLGWGLFGIVAFSVVSTWTGKIDGAGATAGGLIAMGLFLGGNFPALVPLFLFFVLGTLASSWGRRRKQALGLAQEDGGQRGLRHALANGGVAGLAGLLAWSLPGQETLWLTALAGALASAIGDTLSSELGNLYGRRYLDLLTLQPGERGQDGVISLEGTLLGAGGSLLMALVAAWGLPGVLWWAVLLGGLAGNLADSLLGATLQRRGLMTNHSVNFACTIAGATVAALLGG